MRLEVARERAELLEKLARDGYGLAKGRAGPSAVEPPAKPRKARMQEASEAARGKKLPSRVYLPIEGLEGGSGPHLRGGRMLRLTTGPEGSTI